MANTLVDVNTYVTDQTMPILEAYLTWASLTDNLLEGKFDGTYNRGETITYREPTRFVSHGNLAFNPQNDGDFTERFGTLTISEELRTNYVLTDKEIALYNLEQLGNKFGMEQMASMAGSIDQDIAETACLGAYRHVGNANEGAVTTIQDLRRYITLARNFGGQETLHCVLPDMAMTNIANTGFQEFNNRSNDEMSKDWELSSVNGIANTMFYSSPLCPIHTAGTAAGKELNIVSVEAATVTRGGRTFGATTLNLSGAANGETIVENDVITISGTTPLKFLRIGDFTVSNNDVQGRVTATATADGSGNISIVIEPGLVSTKDSNGQYTVDSTINRPIATATDKVTVTKSHIAGAIFYRKGLKFASPQLGSAAPYISASTTGGMNGVSMRAWHGYIPGYAQTQMVHDLIYGVSVSRDYVMRIIFPVDANDI